MFTLGEVISITLVVSVIVGYLAYQLAEFNMIARILNGMSDSELARLERLKDKLEAAVDDIERDQIFSLRASAGIVSDSMVESEYTETLHKMGSVFKAITNEEISCHVV